MRNLHTYILAQFTIILTFIGCLEPFSIENKTYENALIVETTITNELKHQEVRLTRVVQLTDSTDIFEKNAQVWIETDNQNTYQFTETEQGVYVSDEEFKAFPEIAYKLFITTSEGKRYESREEYLTSDAEIADLYAERETVNGELGVQVYVDSNEDVGEAKYFRYEFEETYKIKTPVNIIYNIKLDNLVLTPPSQFGYVITITDNLEEKTICYAMNIQTEIIQTSLINSSTNNITKYPIRFISKNNSIIREGYSVLVKQYVQSFDSYNYYQNLKKTGSVENLLAENQVGYIKSNISSIGDENEKVIGIFDVSSFSQKRIHFDYSDFDLDKPDYPYNCFNDTLFYPRTPPSSSTYPDWVFRLYSHLEVRSPPWELIDTLCKYSVDPPGLVMIKPECSNCNTIGTSVKPDFWED